MGKDASAAAIEGREFRAHTPHLTLDAVPYAAVGRCDCDGAVLLLPDGSGRCVECGQRYDVAFLVRLTRRPR